MVNTSSLSFAGLFVGMLWAVFGRVFLLTLIFPFEARDSVARCEQNVAALRVDIAERGRGWEASLASWRVCR